MNPRFGKHRGTVVDNKDPLGLGRIKASVPNVTGEGDSGWAMPSSPLAGPGIGLWAVPPEKAKVWIEYEEGDVSHPIWSGCFWARGEVPHEATQSEVLVLKTNACTVVLDDRPDHAGVTIETAEMKIVLGRDGVMITNGTATIEVAGNAVRINGDALEVR